MDNNFCVRDSLQENLDETENIGKNTREKIPFTQEELDFITNLINKSKKQQKITDNDIKQAKMKIKLWWTVHYKTKLSLIILAVIVILGIPLCSFYFYIETNNHKEVFEGIFIAVKWVYVTFGSGIVGVIVDRLIFNKK